MARFALTMLVFGGWGLAQERPEVLKQAEAELSVALRWMTAAHHTWPKLPESATGARGMTSGDQLKVATKQSTSQDSGPSAERAEEQRRLADALSRLIPTGRLIWDASLKLYVPEFRPEPKSTSQSK